ncbi:LLM class flavin-dependent oxidoreductase [Cellulomonas massiliensis]|uniref:LLM class flavin-dependent oxidoreductase n=1 Tax=Cellulomonas massiliensis TaxID=1465811 RepID=UPI0002E06B8C|nr:LLM class flavin-dependent oxidoreductase [Cellulomonas massiliensis]
MSAWKRPIGSRTDQLHLGLLVGGVGNHAGAWRRPGSRVEDVTSLRLFAELAQRAEAARIDTLFIADGLNLDVRAAEHSPAGHLEPVTLLSAVAAVTERIGLIPSVSTTFTEPYNLARQLASLDHLSQGRAGWNVVTSAWGERNYGDAPLPSHEDRYRRAAEHVAVARGLWASWGPDALVADRASGRYARPEELRTLAHRGEFYSVEGPLNVPRSPQGRPVLAQAGSSEHGKAFAAPFAELVFTAQQTLRSSQEFYADLKDRVAAAGRSRDHVRVLPGVSPILGSTEAEARAAYRELVGHVDLDRARARLSKQLGGLDLDAIGLDERIPPELLPPVEAVQGRQSRYGVYVELAVVERLTVRELVELEVASSGHWVPVGSVEQVADQLAERFVERGADGFILLPSYLPEGFDLLVDALVPELQDRGLFRTEYESTTLRGHLGLPDVDDDAERHAAAGVEVPTPADALVSAS